MKDKINHLILHDGPYTVDEVKVLLAARVPHTAV